MTRLAVYSSLLALIVLAAPELAEAQGCANSDATFCASVDIRIGGGRSRVVAPPPPPPQPRGQVIIVQPAPPPPPPRQVVVVPQRPRQVVVVQQPAPQPTYYPPVRTLPRQRPQHRRYGWHGRVGGVFGTSGSLGGFHTGLRIRPVPAFAVEIGMGVYGGTDYNDNDRVEFPLTVDAMVFLNPQRRFQVYLLAGVGTSFARTEGYIPALGTFGERSFRYIGGETGIGVEWRITEGFALSTDFRVFLRSRVDSDDGVPEFYDESTGQQSNTSYGAMSSFGATVYW